ncbi:MAG: hypothetical protein JKY61_05965, partial [Planctomycetes bacterium]|nr:hypothetical protein [Planctomycetota bacterium]
MAYLRISNTTLAARIGVLGVVLGILLAWTPVAGAQPLNKRPQDRSFGSLAHSKAPKYIPTLE